MALTLSFDMCLDESVVPESFLGRGNSQAEDVDSIDISIGCYGCCYGSGDLGQPFV